VANGCGTSDEPDPPDRPATTTETQREPETTEPQTQPEPEPKPNASLDQFQSPSGNIGCILSEKLVRCDIKERDWTPPAPDTRCPYDYGQGLQVSDRGEGTVVCAGDTTLNPDAPKLAYGKRTELGDFECRSETNFVSCRNTATGHGFVLNRERYRLF
jgi:hypothetical protein